MLAIFFPHMFEDIEYLLSPDELGQGPEESETPAQETTSTAPRRTTRAVRENAVAGPSRVR